MLHLFKRTKHSVDLSQKAWITKLKESKDPVIIDVRSPKECTSGMINGASNINFFDFNFKEEVAKLDKDKAYFLYCRSGNRSGKACAIMHDLGFKEAYNLIGGMLQWKGEVV